MRELWRQVHATVSKWSDDRAPTMAAAISYYTIFSVAPIVIIATAVAGFVFGDDAARGAIRREIVGLVGDSGAQVVEMAVRNADQPATGVLATIAGIVVVLFGATGVFVELQSSLNKIWKVDPKTKNRHTIIAFLRERILSFAMCLAIGFLLLTSLVISAALAALGSGVERMVPGCGMFAQGLNMIISFAVITTLFATMYKILPDAHVEWRNVWLGAAVTSALFQVGKLLIGLYLGKSSIGSTYGVAGSLVLVLAWVYYSTQVFLLGAVFTQVHTEAYRDRRVRAGASSSAASSAPRDDARRDP